MCERKSDGSVENFDAVLALGRIVSVSASWVISTSFSPIGSVGGLDVVQELPESPEAVSLLSLREFFEEMSASCGVSFVILQLLT